VNILPLLLCDGYKVDHRRQYPDGTTMVYSNFTPRGSRVAGVDRVVFFGLQYFIQEYLVRQFNEHFFQQPEDQVVDEYQRVMDGYLGPGSVSCHHIRSLHQLGYLPLSIKAVHEGTAVKLRTPMLTIMNTHPDFFWLTNKLETILSNVLWMPCTSATTAWMYRKTFDRYAQETGASPDFVPWQGHDFSFRGMAGVEAAVLSGAAHLLSFYGTDTIPAIRFLEQYYPDSTPGIIGGSVPATEHSVMCLGDRNGEIGTFKRLITEIYPSGIVSIVSDTWDFWQVVTDYLSQLKPAIMGRSGKVVIRPDSGDPVKIVCGDHDAEPGTPQHKGAIECLWNTFGGTINAKGYKELDPHIGLIYGDSITTARQESILSQLKAKGFASSNVVLGIGSYTYQHVTRDTFGFAMKATYGEVRGEPREIYKSPKTDGGEKHSARGLLSVVDGELIQQCSKEQEKQGDLRTVFMNSRLQQRQQSLHEVRQRLRSQ